ncbi:MAG: low molecular weight phosphotyrosine protein phosphatase [Rubrivivax sp.]|nr:low molecular weight phosphotyrosine protein phosphatase [Rubrivivax sp.]
MVCTGNICRSPTAEVVLRHKLRQAGLQGQVLVDSAGIQGSHAGEAPDPRAVRHAALRGYDLSALRARPLQAEDFERFHWLLGMDDTHLRWLRRRAPEGHGARIELLLEHALRTAATEVPDPYYGPPEGFEQVLDLVEDACDGLVRRLQVELPARVPPAPPAA